MAEMKWIKITTDIFDDEKILLIENMPEADGIIVVWFKLLCLAGKQNNSGVFAMSNGVPYNETMLASIFRRKESLVAMALQTFEQFGMIEIVNDVITVPNWGKHQNIDGLQKAKEMNRLRQQKYREKQKLLANNILPTENIESTIYSGDSENSNVTVTLHNAKITHTEENKNRLRIEENKNRRDSSGDDTRERARSDSDLAVVMGHYMDLVGSMPPSRVSAAVAGYLDHMDKDVMLDAIERAAAENKRSWSYVEGILKRRKNESIRNMADVAREDEEWERRKARQQSPESNNPFLEMLKEETNEQDGSFENNGSAENSIPRLSQGHE